MLQFTNAGNNFMIWPVRLRPFLNGNQDVFYCPSQDEQCVWKTNPAALFRAAGPIEEQYGYSLAEPVLHYGT